MARRKGNDWFIAGINAGAAKDAEITLPFVRQSDIPADIYNDDGANGISVLHDTINTANTISISMAANGGFCFILDDARDTARDTILSVRNTESISRGAEVSVAYIRNEIEVSAARAGSFNVKIIDMKGRCITEKNAFGSSIVRIDKAKIAAGTVIVMVSGPAFRYSKRMLLR
jgi:hypothetical protein